MDVAAVELQQQQPLPQQPQLQMLLFPGDGDGNGVEVEGVGGSLGGMNHRHSLIQPDALKLCSQLALLKHLHRTAFIIDEDLGDKSSGKTFFLKGIQGKVSRPCWNRDYFYLNGKLQIVRDYLAENCVQTVAVELFRLALDIFNRYDNRRRMGVELLVLAMLGNQKLSSFEMPDKYYTHFFVIDMLVSCRHRFQKPDASFFWSKQSESILLSFLRQTTNTLTKLSLPLVNDMILTAIAVNARHLEELEVQLALDCSEEGLLAIAGKSISRKDQGFHRSWDNAMYVHKDFGSPKDWYIKDTLLFTSPLLTKRSLPPVQCDKLPELFDTGFGCKKLKRFAFRGDMIFPPFAQRAKYVKREKGPVLEIGIYALLIGLPKLREFVTGSTALAVARLRTVLEKNLYEKLELPLEKLSFVCDESHTSQDLVALAKLLPNLRELLNVSVGCVLSDENSGASNGRQLCSFIRKFPKLKKISLNLDIHCFNSFLKSSPCGRNLTVIVLSTVVRKPSDLVLMRRCAPNLEKFEGRFSTTSTTAMTMAALTVEQQTSTDNDVHHRHDNDFYDGDSEFSVSERISKFPWRKLRSVELSGRLNVDILKVIVGNAEQLEYLSVTSWPSEVSNNSVALSDEWLTTLLAVNPLPNIRELSLRMDSERYVEDGNFTKSGLQFFLNHAVERCPKLERLVGEFTRVPDSELAALEQKCSKRGLKGLKIKNAEPYREFQNSEENDRVYGMNEGYWRLLHRNNNENVLQGTPPERYKNRRTWGYVYRPFIVNPHQASSSSDNNI